MITGFGMTLTYICFEPRSLRATDVVDLVTGHRLGFEPTELRAAGLQGGASLVFDHETLTRLRSASGATWIHVEGHGGSLRLTGFAGQPGQVLVWATPASPPPGLLDAATRLPGFIHSVTGDGDDLFWQSADQISTYEVHRRPWSHLPRIHDPVLGRPTIDVSRNPGRAAAAGGLWLWAGAELRFGPAAFSVIDHDRLLAAPATVTEGDDGVVHVRLFSPDDDLGSIRAAQKAFRNWLDYDGLEARAAELAARFEPDHGAEAAPATGSSDSWSRLSAATDALEQALAAHGHRQAARSLASILLPLIHDIRTGGVTEPIGIERYPSTLHLENETDFRDHPALVEAHTAFREEVTVGSAADPTEAAILGRLDARRRSR